MTRIRVERPIAADPASTALLLAGPTAFDLWPGLRRVGGDRRRVIAEADLPVPAIGRGALLNVRALPPRRTPTAFVTRFECASDDVPGATGVLTLGYDRDADGHVTTTATLELDTEAGPRLVRELRERASGFLANLAAVAESRAYAA